MAIGPAVIAIALASALPGYLKARSNIGAPIAGWGREGSR